MAHTTKTKQVKIRLTPEKAAALNAHLESNGLKLQDFLENYIDKVLEKNKK